MPDDTLTLSVRITGRVQGVWFRGWTQAEARARGLSGWVRNETDGSVTALLHGPEEAVRQMVEALHTGPSSARVKSVVTVVSTQQPERGEFTIRR